MLLHQFIIGKEWPHPQFANRDIWDICEGSQVETSVTPLSARADSADQTGEAGVPFLSSLPHIHLSQSCMLRH